MTTRLASCSCNQLTIAVDGDPVRISICHCFACQRRTGSPFGAQARFPRDAVRPSGRATTYVRTADSGQAVRLSFCPDCGATVYYELDALPGFVGVPIGAFADPGFPAPTVSIYEEHRHPWVGLPDEIEHLD